MWDDQISSNISLWNLDGLSKNKALKGDGRIHAVDLKARPGRVTRVGVLENESQENNPTLVAFLPDERALLGVNMARPDKVYELKGWKKEDYVDVAAQGPPRRRLLKPSEQKKEDYVDVAAQGQYLCVLSLNRQESQAQAEVFHFYRNALQRFSVPRLLPLASFNADSRIALSLREDGKKPLPDTVYIVSGAKSQITALPLIGKRPTQTIEVKVSRGPGKLGKEIYVAHDPVKGTLILSDTLNHRIVEVSLDDGNAEVICGTGDALASDDGDLAFNTSVSSPRGIALYRHAKVIDKDFLESTIMLDDYDLSGVRPRALLFVESGTSCVRKLLDLPTQAETHELPSEPTLFTLMGRRKNSPKVAGQSGGDDLRSYVLSDPVDVAASRRGELLVGCAKMLYFLRPLTSLGELVVQEKSEATEQDYES